MDAKAIFGFELLGGGRLLSMRDAAAVRAALEQPRTEFTRAEIVCAALKANGYWHEGTGAYDGYEPASKNLVWATEIKLQQTRFKSDLFGWGHNICRSPLLIAQGWN